MSKLIGLAYLIIGLVVAAANNYFDKLGSVKGILSAILAVILWPLVLVGVDLHIGGKDKGKKDALDEAALIAAFLPASLALMRAQAWEAIERAGLRLRRASDEPSL